MRRLVSVTLAVALVFGVAGVALAHGPGWWMGGMGPGMMGGWGGPGMGWRAGAGPGGFGPGACPMWGAAQPGAPAPEQISEEKAKELATEYANKYLQGYTVERVLPFTGRLHTMYQAELKGPKGETRYLHITPWGGVRPFGPPRAALQ
jgi:hypothetical protein